uniref:Uncharacterized protein n=1 Tax=Arundo donax TaxID=35708 RepID=A0A0A9G2N8_ARUDO
MAPRRAKNPRKVKPARASNLTCLFFQAHCVGCPCATEVVHCSMDSPILSLYSSFPSPSLLSCSRR